MLVTKHSCGCHGKHGLGDGDTIDISGAYAGSDAWKSANGPSFWASSTANSSMPFWENLFGLGVNKIAVPILNAQFGGPQPGQYFATGPNGQSVAYALPQGAAGGVFANSPFGSFSSSGLLTWAIIGGVVLFAFSALRK